MLNEEISETSSGHGSPTTTYDLELTLPPSISDKTSTHEPQLFCDALDVTSEAVLNFEVLAKCTYANKNLGSSGQQEYMTCDCEEQWDSELDLNIACGEDSYCINRVTSVECVEGHCACGSACQNQRFQRRQYANVLVIQTEKKGYGLRVDSALSTHDFIYEYIGEVIDEATFRTRMIEYDTLQFKHFYFMMLKSDSFIDATIKGSLARFCNHSCRPNAYVDKWMVGGKLRMGIFAKRAIVAGEEITFDYNVDRYGAESQPCFCGEPNCVKFIGGKTQTDAALLLPDGIADALGVSPKQERAWLKQNKHLRSKQQSNEAVINEEFVKSLDVVELQTGDVSKAMGALMKNQDLGVTKKLVERVLKTNDVATNSLIIKYHGYKTLSSILKQAMGKDDTLIEDVLTILGKWPAVTRNKISSLQIESVIKDLSEQSENQKLVDACKDLLAEWSKLQMAYRIPKASSDTFLNLYGLKLSRCPERNAGECGDSATPINSGNIEHGSSETMSNIAPLTDANGLPQGWEMALDPNTLTRYYFNRATGVSLWEFPLVSRKYEAHSRLENLPHSLISRGPKGQNQSSSHKSAPVPLGPTPDSGKDVKNGDFKKEVQLAKREQERLRLEKEEQHAKYLKRENELRELITKSKEEEDHRRQLAEQKRSTEKNSRHNIRHREKGSTNSSSTSRRAGLNKASMESQWTKAFAKYVPNFIKLHEKEIGRENVKGCARDLVKILCQKQLKRDPTGVPPSVLDSGKLKKVQGFCEEFMAKFMLKYSAKHDRKRTVPLRGPEPSSGNSSSDKKRIKI